MTTHQAPRSVVKLACLTLLGGLPVLWTGGSLVAQEDKPAEGAKAQDQRSRPSLVVAGYTRPGNPSDRAKGGKILPGGYLGGNPDFKGVGGTVFFAVFRLTSEDGDVWGTGVMDFDSTFVPGVDFNNADSPVLDTRAKYLYLYQVVNSRGLDPISPVIFAANKDKGTQAIASAAVRLRVDPRYITSWGSFKATGLTLGVMPDGWEEKKAAAKGIQEAVGEKAKPSAVKPALEEEKEGIIRMAVSVNPSILGALSTNAYRFRAPSHLLRRVRVNDASLNLANSNAMKELQKRVDALKKNNDKPAAWVGEMLRSAKAATEPAAVRLVLSDPEGRLYLQAEWAARGGAGLLNLADHSTVFGFTTDLPPVPEPVGIAAPDARENLLAVLDGLAGDVAGAAGAVVPAAWVGAGGGDASGVAPAAALGVAPGTAVGPIQPAAFTPAAVTPGVGISTFGSALAPPAGFGAGFPGWPGVGALGRAFPPNTNGAGSGNGSGNNSGSQAQNQKQQQQGNQSLTNNINVNISLSNQQSQSQSQQQHQNQHQRQNQNNRRHHVVPEPGTLLLGLIGLPALVRFYRRRKVAQATAMA